MFNPQATLSSGKASAILSRERRRGGRTFPLFLIDLCSRAHREYQQTVMNWMLALNFLLVKSRNDAVWRNLLMQDQEQLLKTIDLDVIGVFKQPGFLYARYFAEIYLNALQIKTRKSDLINSGTHTHMPSAPTSYLSPSLTPPPPQDKFSLLRKNLISSKVRELADISKQLETAI